MQRSDIHTVTNLESVTAVRSPSIFNFSDLCKVFASVHQPALWKILRMYGITEQTRKCTLWRCKSTPTPRRNWARTPSHVHLGANFWSAGKNSPGSTCTPNLKNVASSDTEILRGSRNSEIGHVPQATPTWGPISGLRARTAQDPRAHQI